MRTTKILMISAAALAIGACGGEKSAGGETKASAAALKTSAGSPLDQSFSFSGGEQMDLDAVLTLLPDDARPTYENASFDESIGATVVENLRFSDADDGEAILIERAELYGVDQSAIERITNAENSGPDAQFETVFQKIRLLNVKAEGFDKEEINFEIGGVEFDKLAVRQGGGENPDGAEAANFFNAFTLAGLYFKDISMDAEDDEFGGAVDFSAPDLRFVGLEGGKISAIIAKDFGYSTTQGEGARQVLRDAMGPQGGPLVDGPLGMMLAPESQRAEVEALEWRNIDLSGLMDFGLKGDEPPVSARNLMDLGTMKATGMTSYVNDRPLFIAEEVSLSAAEFAWLIPSKIRMDTKNATYDFTAYVADENAPAYDVLKAQGLDNVKGAGFAEWTWNPDRGGARLQYNAESEGLADFSMAFDLGGMKLSDIGEAIENDVDNPIAQTASFKSMSFKIDDEKALDAIFALSALQMGGTGEDLRQSAPALLRLSGAQFVQGIPRAQGYLSAFADFIAEGGSLEISANPEEPLDLQAVQASAVAPQALPDVLNLTVTHSE
ncbi:MAG: hypothetical protein AAGD92_10510 [Pseudomonadota bacterium]